jgi:hemoglobin
VSTQIESNPSTAGAEPPLRVTPYELIGGTEDAVRHLVTCFYEVMDTDPEMKTLRALHAGDLSPMRERLTWFMSGWLGGPALYAERNDGSVCITKAHQPFPIDAEMRDLWMTCMRRALEKAGTPEPVRQMLDAPLARVAEFLRNR